LGDERCSALEYVTCDGAEWIHTVVSEKAKNATVCLDTLWSTGMSPYSVLRIPVDN